MRFATDPHFLLYSLYGLGAVFLLINLQQTSDHHEVGAVPGAQVAVGIPVERR